MPNCEFFFPTLSRCLLCSPGYLEQSGNCILKSVCTTPDPNIPRCRDVIEICNDELKVAPACNAC